VIRSHRPDNFAVYERHSAPVCLERADIPENRRSKPFARTWEPITAGKSNALFGKENAQFGKKVSYISIMPCASSEILFFMPNISWMF